MPKGQFSIKLQWHFPFSNKKSPCDKRGTNLLAVPPSFEAEASHSYKLTTVAAKSFDFELKGRFKKRFLGVFHHTTPSLQKHTNLY